MLVAAAFRLSVKGPSFCVQERVGIDRLWTRSRVQKNT